MSISRSTFYGGGKYHTLTGDHDVKIGEGRLQVFDTNGATRNVDMPAATDPRIHPGGPVFYILNIGAQAITLRDSGGTQIGSTTLDTDELALMLLVDDSDADGEWYAKINPVGVIPDAGLSAALYSFGGAPADDLHQYDHVVDSWTQKTDLVVLCALGQGFAIGTVGVYFGHQSTPRDKCTKYDPDVHTALTDLAFGSPYDGQASGADGKGYLYGHTLDTDQVQEFTLGTDSWAAETDLTTVCAEGGGETADDKPYCFSGRKGGTPQSSEVQQYTPSTTVWAAKQAQPFPLVNAQSILSLNDKLHRVGGDKKANDSVDDHDQYSPIIDSWVAKTNAPEIISAATHASPENIGIYAAGWSAGGTTDAFKYAQSTDTFTQIDDSPVTTSSATGISIKP